MDSDTHNMLRGIYTGATGMVAQQNRMDALANNLANVDTTGYKKDTSVHKAFPELLIRRTNDTGLYKFPFGSSEIAPIVGKLGTGVEQNETFTVFEQGAMKPTSNPFDLALDHKGFFTVQTPEGDRYTRNGSFILGKEGLLVTKDGFPVLGEKGPISIKANNFTVDGEGRVWANKHLQDDPLRMVSMEENDWADTVLVDRLKIVDFQFPREIKKVGNSFWKETPDSGPPRIMETEKDRPKVIQGFLEASNVSAVREMVDMIEVNRAYEANQKVIQTQDGLLGKLINEAVRV